MNIPTVSGITALNRDTIKKFTEPDPTMADKYTVKHFIRNNKELKGFSFARNNPIREHFGPAFLLKKHFNSLGISPSEGRPGGLKESPKKWMNKERLGTIINVRNKNFNHAFTMHELGHAKDFNNGPALGLKKGLSMLRAPLHRNLAGVATIGMLSNEKTEKYAPAVAALPGLAALREEAAANYHAYKGIKAHKGAEAGSKFLTKILPKQMGSYALEAAAPVVATYASLKLLQKLRERRRLKAEKEMG